MGPIFQRSLNDPSFPAIKEDRSGKAEMKQFSHDKKQAQKDQTLS